MKGKFVDFFCVCPWYGKRTLQFNVFRKLDLENLIPYIEVLLAPMYTMFIRPTCLSAHLWFFWGERSTFLRTAIHHLKFSLIWCFPFNRWIPFQQKSKQQLPLFVTFLVSPGYMEMQFTHVYLVNQSENQILAKDINPLLGSYSIIPLFIQFIVSWYFKSLRVTFSYLISQVTGPFQANFT